MIERAWQAISEFFDLPFTEKKMSESPDQAKYPFGYHAVGAENLSAGKIKEKELNGASSSSDGKANTASSQSTPPDMKEMFTIGPQNLKSGFPLRRFPENPASLEPALTEYYEKMNDLARLLLKLFAINLKLGDENFFDQFTDHHASALRTVHYPEVPASTGLLPGQLRCSAHTDYGTITILRTDGPGLQVSKDLDPPVWHDVPFVPDSFIINLGDLMRRWTNDKWLSTLHRVVVKEGDFTEEADTQMTQDD